MADSKKRTAKTTTPGPRGRQGSKKERAASHARTARPGASARSTSPSPSKKGQVRSKNRTDAAPPAGGALEVSLRDAREQIRGLIEERDNQAALLEATDVEREILQKQVEQLQEKLRQQEQREPQQQWRSEGGTRARGDQEIEVEFEEDAEDLEDVAEGGHVDDVDEIYEQLDDPRVRRQELDRERIDREGEMGDEPYWLVCPKCGDNLEEIEAEDVKLERCESCGGIYLDRGEVEMLLVLAKGRRGLRRIRNVLQI